MAYPAVPRIEWAPDGARVLAFHARGIALHRVDAAGRTVLPGGPYLDARWLADGRIVAVDVFARPEHFTIHGVPYAVSGEPGAYEYAAAAIAAGGSDFVAIAPNLTLQPLFVAATGPPYDRWTFDRHRYHINPEPERLAAALSADGRILAIGYETRAWENGRVSTASGRGWLVLDLTPPAKPPRYGRPVPPVLDRAWYEVVRDNAPVRLAFDRGGPRRRLAIAAPEREPGIGVIRLGAEAIPPKRGEPVAIYPRTHHGGARAVALDDRGLLAAYAYPTGVGERRVRVDYLAPQAKGKPVVELLDTLWIDPDLGEVVALAFDPSSRRIACLGPAGEVEVVPVP